MQTIGILPDFFKKKGSKMNRAKRVYRRLLGKKPKTYASSPTGSLPPSPIGGRSPAVLRRNTFKRSRMSLNRMWRRSVNFLNTYLHSTTWNPKILHTFDDLSNIVRIMAENLKNLIHSHGGLSI